MSIDLNPVDTVDNFVDN